MSKGLYEPAARRFWRYVRKTETCWLWTACVNDKGYGRFGAGGPPGGKPRQVYAHRYAWEQLRGEIPAGLTLDHKCGVHRCVNPDHMEPVTLQENARRGSRRRHPTALPQSDPPLSLF